MREIIHTHSPVEREGGGGLARFRQPFYTQVRIIRIMLNLLCNTFNDLIFYELLLLYVNQHVVSCATQTGLIVALKLDL